MQRPAAKSLYNADIIQFKQESRAAAKIKARCALYMGALKIVETPDYTHGHGYFSQKFSWAFVPIEPMNVRT